jgi:cytochrome c
MTNRNALMTILGVALTLAARVGLCTDSVASAGMHVRTPDSAAARAASALIARVQRALTGYFEACTLGDGRALDAITTSDARFEYTLQEAGSYLSVDATSLRAACPSERAVSVSELWIFPTNDPDAVFVRYAPGSLAGGTEQQLALVEMRGERIARMLNFSAPTPLQAPATASSTPHCAPAADAASTGRAAFNNHCRTCHSLREGDDRLGPSLHRVFGTESRLRSDSYDRALDSSSSRIMWDEATLDRFIADPDQVIPNDMKPYRGIPDAAVRKRIVEFLKTNPDPWGE